LGERSHRKGGKLVRWGKVLRCGGERKKEEKGGRRKGKLGPVEWRHVTRSYNFSIKEERGKGRGGGEGQLCQDPKSRRRHRISFMFYKKKERKRKEASGARPYQKTSKSLNGLGAHVTAREEKKKKKEKTKNRTPLIAIRGGGGWLEDKDRHLWVCAAPGEKGGGKEGGGEKKGEERIQGHEPRSNP